VNPAAKEIDDLEGDLIEDSGDDDRDHL